MDPRLQRASPAFVLALALLVATTAAAQSYTAVDLGVLPGQTTSVATDINNRRQIVGFSGSQAFLWDPINGMRALGVNANRLRNNNGGIIAGVRSIDGRSRPFAWIDGLVHDLPTPRGEEIWVVRDLTDSNILVMCGSRCWGLYAGALYDLNALTGASIFAVNETATLGGTLAEDAYLRFPDGRVITPWRRAEFPQTPGPAAVEVIGPAGHFAGRAGAVAWYGVPDGAAAPMGLSAPARGGFSLHDINRSGDVVVTLRLSNLLPDLNTGILYSNGRITNLNASIGSGPSAIREAVAINDARAIAATASVEGASRAVLLVPIVPAAPTNLTVVVTGAVVSLSWNPVVGALDYVVEAGSTPGARDLYNAPVGTQPLFVTPAPPGRYYVRVRARNAAAVSAPSNEVIVDVR